MLIMYLASDHSGSRLLQDRAVYVVDETALMLAAHLTSCLQTLSMVRVLLLWFWHLTSLLSTALGRSCTGSRKPPFEAFCEQISVLRAAPLFEK
jgi:hypothetical protein